MCGFHTARLTGCGVGGEVENGNGYLQSARKSARLILQLLTNGGGGIGTTQECLDRSVFDLWGRTTQGGYLRPGFCGSLEV
jgi:hypothetical protein